jgi:hypothetical protein
MDLMSENTGIVDLFGLGIAMSSRTRLFRVRQIGICGVKKK